MHKVKKQYLRAEIIFSRGQVRLRYEGNKTYCQEEKGILNNCYLFKEHLHALWQTWRIVFKSCKRSKKRELKKTSNKKRNRRKSSLCEKPKLNLKTVFKINQMYSISSKNDIKIYRVGTKIRSVSKWISKTVCWYLYIYLFNLIHTISFHHLPFHDPSLPEFGIFWFKQWRP